VKAPSEMKVIAFDRMSMSRSDAAALENTLLEMDVIRLFCIQNCCTPTGQSVGMFTRLSRWQSYFIAAFAKLQV